MLSCYGISNDYLASHANILFGEESPAWLLQHMKQLCDVKLKYIQALALTDPLASKRRMLMTTTGVWL